MIWIKGGYHLAGLMSNSHSISPEFTSVVGNQPMYTDKHFCRNLEGVHVTGQ